MHFNDCLSINAITSLKNHKKVTPVSFNRLTVSLKVVFKISPKGTSLQGNKVAVNIDDYSVVIPFFS